MGDFEKSKFTEGLRTIVFQKMAKRVLIIGTNRGIGLELVKNYANQGATVYALCRKASAELREVKNTTVLEGFDVSNDGVMAQIRDCKELPNALDIIIANAGVLERNSFNEIQSTESLMKQFNTNSLGPLRLARGCVDRMNDGTKFAIITSRMGSIEDNGSGGMYGYRMSKCAVNAMGKSLSVDLKEKGIAVGILHPGYVRTDMTGHNGLIDPPESAAGLVARINDLNIDNSGTFWHMNGDVLPW